jgi:hypothetical protein
VVDMALDKEEVEDFKQMIGVFVLFYKIVWSEVEKQFSELSTEEKHKVFGVIAPSIVGMLKMTADESNIDETNPKERNKRRKKR